MSFFDRFRHPIKYVLQMKKGKGFETLREYDPKDYPIAPSETVFADDIEDEDVYHRLLAIYPSGNNKIIHEHKGKRKTKETKKSSITQLRGEVQEALKPLTEIKGLIEDINNALSGFGGSGEGGGLTPEDVKAAIHEEMGGSGMNFQMPTPPPWIWMFHPWVRAGEKDIIDSVEGMFKRVGEHIAKSITGAGEAKEDIGMPDLTNVSVPDVVVIEAHKEEKATVPEPGEGTLTTVPEPKEPETKKLRKKKPPKAIPEDEPEDEASEEDLTRADELEDEDDE